jgi:hypothetical protein
MRDAAGAVGHLEVKYIWEAERGIISNNKCGSINILMLFWAEIVLWFSDDKIFILVPFRLTNFHFEGILYTQVVAVFY